MSADPRSPSAAKERAVSALIRKMMALPNDPASRREMKAAGRQALDLLDDLERERKEAARGR